jgi:hypothetical protein
VLAAEPAAPPDAWFGLAETLVVLADRTRACAAALPDSRLTSTSLREAAVAALPLYDEADAAYARLDSPASAVNRGNALCAAAEAVTEAADGGGDKAAALATARALVGRAVDGYRAVLAAAPDDTDTAVNLADALKQGADLAAEAGDAGAARALFRAAAEGYAAAVATASSEDGDDLPSLLHNWGVALASAASALADPALLEAAAARLRQAAAFARGDVAPLLALGDVLCDAAAAAASPASAADLLAAAVADGYRAALAIDRKCADAHAGVADVSLALCRAAAAAGDGAAARAHATDAVHAYSRALAEPHRLGGWRERGEARYNHACALALAGEGERARAAVASLVAAGATTEAEVKADPDLAGVMV